MKKYIKAIGGLLVLALTVMMLSGAVLASDDDNSLYDLGITTEGATVDPAFSYDVWECTVTVPAGTTELSLSPVPSSENATIADISGTTLNADGTGTVYITVRSASGSDFTYTLHVVSDNAPLTSPEPETEAAAAQTEAPQPVTEAETEPQTEDSRYVKVDKNTIQEAENTITELKEEIVTHKETIDLYTKVMIGLIAVAVIMLFIIINMAIRKRDIKLELKEYRSLGYGSEKAAKKGKAKKQAAPAQPMRTQPMQAQSMRTQPMQNQPMQAQSMRTQPMQNQPMQSQPMKGQPVPQFQQSSAAQTGGMQRYAAPAREMKNNGSLDVTPQTSRKNHVMPEYRQTMPEAQNEVPAQQSGQEEAQLARDAKRAQKAAAKEAAAAEKAARKEAAAAEKAARQEAAQRAQQQKAIQAAAMSASRKNEQPAPAAPSKDVEVNMIDL